MEMAIITICVVLVTLSYFGFFRWVRKFYISKLPKDKRTTTHGVAEGTFGIFTRKLIEGKIIFPNGNVEEGMRDKDTGFLIEGKIIFPDGRIEEGKFDKDTGKLIEE